MKNTIKSMTYKSTLFYIFYYKQQELTLCKSILYHKEDICKSILYHKEDICKSILYHKEA